MYNLLALLIIVFVVAAFLFYIDRQNERRDKAEKEESKDGAKKAAPRRATPGERARAMSAAVGLDTSPDAPKKRAARFGSGTGGMAKKPKTKMPARTRSSYKSAKPKAAAKPVEAGMSMAQLTPMNSPKTSNSQKVWADGTNNIRKALPTPLKRINRVLSYLSARRPKGP